MFASVVAMLAPKLARAQSYEYTPKVASTTGGVAKSQNGLEWRGVSNWGVITPEYYASCAIACTTLFPLDSHNVGYYYSWNNLAPGYECVRHTGPSGTGTGSYFGTCQSRPKMECPQGTMEGAGGLCYSAVCPTATPPWESDPANSSQCRRAVNCPAPQVFSAAANNGAGGCTCPAGRQVYVPDGGGIAEVAVWTSSSPASSAPSSLPATLCGRTGSNTAGCAVSVDAGGWNGTRVEYSGTVLTGATCTAAAGTDTGSGVQCPAGQVSGTINGTTVCVTAGVTETKKPPTTTTETKTNPDGSTVTTTTTTQETTKCEGGICTTTISKTVTEVTKDPQGNTTGTTTTGGTTTTPGTGSGGNGDGDGDGVPSSFGGACPSFSCDGDAVQCAMALEQHRRNCELLTDKGAFTREDAEGEFDTSRNFDPAQLTTEGSLASISSSTFLGGGCLADATYNVHGYSFVIPFSSLCVYLQAAGLAFLAVCGLISFGIVSRGVTA